MAWDFSTEPEFQEQLDWVADFCKNEVEPLDLVFPGAAYSRNPKSKMLADPLKQQVNDRGLWATWRCWRPTARTSRSRSGCFPC